MILAVDIGNSNIVLGGIVGDEIVFDARIATNRIKTSDQYCVEIKSILDLYGIDIPKLRGSIISSVVPPVFSAVHSSVQRLTGKPPLVVGPGIRTGLNILMDNPAQVGADLIVDAVAGLSLYTPPLIVIDMGTATTISVVDKNGNYIGGSIIPGVKISLDALTSRTAQLPGINLERPKKLVGKNTVDCMKSGVLYGNAAMLDGMIERYEEFLGERATVIATGGVAQSIAPLCKKEVHYDGNLLLHGLALLYRNNEQRT